MAVEGLFSQPLSVEAQADRLIGRGLMADRDELIARLKAVNYYRLSGYLYPFRCADHTYQPGTTLNTVWRRYNFDRRLRMLLLDAIERIEVAARTRLIHHFVQTHGPFGHLCEINLPGFQKKSKSSERKVFEIWLNKLLNEERRASDTFVKHFRSTYGDRHEYLPLWMACELMTCETTLQFANGVDGTILKQASADFGFPDQQFLSWTKALFTLRNSCAHHARVWNRVFGVKPSVPGKNKNPKWHVQPCFAHDRVGLMLTVCHHWLGKMTSTTQWKARLFALFDEFPEIPLRKMGIPESWRTHPLWI